MIRITIKINAEYKIHTILIASLRSIKEKKRIVKITDTLSPEKEAVPVNGKSETEAVKEELVS